MGFNIQKPPSPLQYCSSIYILLVEKLIFWFFICFLISCILFFLLTCFSLINILIYLISFFWVQDLVCWKSLKHNCLYSLMPCICKFNYMPFIICIKKLGLVHSKCWGPPPSKEQLAAKTNISICMRMSSIQPSFLLCSE